MDKYDYVFIEQCINHYNEKESNENTSLIINVSLIRKKIHHDFLEDLIIFVESFGFNAYFCNKEKKLIAFPVRKNNLSDKF